MNEASPPFKFSQLIQETNVPDWLQPPKRHESGYYNEWTWEETLRRISEGETMKSICKDPAMPSRGEYMRWIFEDKKRKARYREAQKLAAEAMGDDCLDDLSADTDENGAPINLELVKERNRHRKFMMMVFDRDRFSEKQQTQASVNINVGGLALDALRHKEVTNVIEHEETPVLEHDPDD